MVRIVIECRSRWIAKALLEKIAEIVEEFEITHNFNSPAVTKMEVVE